MLHRCCIIRTFCIVCTVLIVFVFFLSNCRSVTENDEEERKLLQCLRKSVISPYKRDVVCLPSSTVVGPATSSPCMTETQSFASPHNKGSSLKVKPSPRRESTSKTWTSPRRFTPRKRAIAKTHVSTPPLRKSGHFSVSDRRKAIATSRRTPNKNRSQTPCKSTKQTPAKGLLTVDIVIFFIHDFDLTDTELMPYLFNYFAIVVCLLHRCNITGWSLATVMVAFAHIAAVWYAWCMLLFASSLCEDWMSSLPTQTVVSLSGTCTLKMPLPMRDPGLHLMHDSLGPMGPHAKWHLDQFSQFLCPTDRHADHGILVGLAHIEHC